MIQPTRLRRAPALRAALIAPLMVVAGATAWLPAHAQQAAAPAEAASKPGSNLKVRPEFLKGFTEVQQAIGAQRWAEARDKLAPLQALSDPNTDESYLMARAQAAIAQGQGDHAGALEAMKRALASPSMSAAERPALQDATIQLALAAKDYPAARQMIEQHIADRGASANPQMRRVYAQLLGQMNDTKGAATAWAAYVGAEEAAGRAVPEDVLRQLADAQQRAGDQAGYDATLTRLGKVSNKSDVWQALLQRTVQASGFPRERLQLDVYRLMRYAELPMSGAQLGDMAQRAQQAGYPAEAQALLDEGFSTGKIGKDANAAADRRLRDLATKGAAKDRAALAESESAARRDAAGNALVSLGMAMSGAGQHDKAVQLIEAGIAKGGLKQPGEALLHLGIAQLRAGRAQDALASWAKVQGDDGVQQLARLWTQAVQARAPR